MTKITFSEMTRAAPMADFVVGQFVAWDNAHLSGGVQMPAGFGSTEEAAKDEALSFLHESGLKGGADDLISRIDEIVEDPDTDTDTDEEE